MSPTATTTKVFMPNIQELYQAEAEMLLSLIEDKVKYHESLGYKDTKNLDIYDFWQIINNIQKFDTEISETKYLKRHLSADLISIAKNIERDFRQKVVEIAENNRKIHEEIRELKDKKKSIIFRSLLHAKWPFQKEYNDVDYKIVTLQNKIAYNERQIDKILESKVVIDSNRIAEIVNFIKEKYFFQEAVEVA